MHAEPPDLKTFPIVRSRPSNRFSHLRDPMYLPPAQEVERRVLQWLKEKEGRMRALGKARADSAPPPPPPRPAQQSPAEGNDQPNLPTPLTVELTPSDIEYILTPGPDSTGIEDESQRP